MIREEEIEDLSALPQDLEGAQPQADQQTPAAETEEKKVLRVQLRNGRSYTGETERDIMQAMADDFERYQTDMETRSRQEGEARGKIRYQQEHQPVVSGEWDAQKYLDLLGKDPMAARRYQDKFYLGMSDDEDPAQVVRFSYQVADRIADTLEISEFQRMNADKDGKTISMSEGDAQALLRRIDQEGLQLTARNLNAVYHEMVRAGSIQIQQPEQTAQYEDIDLRPKSRGAGAPRATGGGSAAQTSTRFSKDLNTMTQEEIVKEIARLQSQGQ